MALGGCLDLGGLGGMALEGLVWSVLATRGSSLGIQTLGCLVLCRVCGSGSAVSGGTSSVGVGPGGPAALADLGGTDLSGTGGFTSATLTWVVTDWEAIASLMAWYPLATRYQVTCPWRGQ